MIPEAVAVVALYAAGVDPDRAWQSRGWEKAPLVTLSGVNRGTASPTTLQARWNNQWLFLLFQCGDDEGVSTGKTDGLDHFLRGDVGEVFLGRIWRCTPRLPGGRLSILSPLTGRKMRLHPRLIRSRCIRRRSPRVGVASWLFRGRSCLGGQTMGAGKFWQVATTTAYLGTNRFFLVFLPRMPILIFIGGTVLLG